MSKAFFNEAGHIYFGDRVDANHVEATAAQISAYYAAPQIPPIVTMRQARLALLNVGMLPNVNAAIAGMAGAAGDAARIEWEYAATVDRNSPLVASLAGALALSAAELDALFTAAGAL